MNKELLIPDPTLASNLQEVQESVKKACKEAGRNFDTVNLLAVSKFHSAEAVASLALLGHRQFAESYFQEAKQKRIELKELLPKEIYEEIQWHSIGHIQTNKAKEVCDNYALVHAVDSERLILAINKAFAKKYEGISHEKKNISETNTENNSLAQNLQKQNVLLEVNIAEENQKAGVPKKDCAKLIEKILESPYINLQGFMCLPPLQARAEDNRPYFKALYELRNEMESLFRISLPELSMGTSSDYTEAILEGATFVRVGTNLFGARNYD